MSLADGVTLVGCEMRVIAVIQDLEEIRHILLHLIRIGRAPPGLDASQLN